MAKSKFSVATRIYIRERNMIMLDSMKTDRPAEYARAWKAFYEGDTKTVFFTGLERTRVTHAWSKAMSYMMVDRKAPMPAEVGADMAKVDWNYKLYGCNADGVVKVFKDWSDDLGRRLDDANQRIAA